MQKIRELSEEDDARTASLEQRQDLKNNAQNFNSFDQLDRNQVDTYRTGSFVVNSNNRQLQNSIKVTAKRYLPVPTSQRVNKRSLSYGAMLGAGRDVQG